MNLRNYFIGQNKLMIITVTLTFPIEMKIKRVTIKPKKCFFKKTKTVEDRLIEINENLSSLDLSKKTPRQLVALQIERDALQMPQSSQETNDYIDNILETPSQTEQAEKLKKPRGRPRKVNNESMVIRQFKTNEFIIQEATNKNNNYLIIYKN